VVESEGVVLSDDLAVNVREPEQDGDDSDTETGKDDGEGNGGLGKLVEVKRRCSLVDCRC